MFVTSYAIDNRFSALQVSLAAVSNVLISDIEDIVNVCGNILFAVDALIPEYETIHL